MTTTSPNQQRLEALADDQAKDLASIAERAEAGEDAEDIFREIFGTSAWAAIQEPRPDPRDVRLKIQMSGHLALAHPMADGPCIIKIQQVPATVSDADVLRRMDSVVVLRRDKTLHYSEIKSGAVLR
jgi:hypothetical protein